MAGMIQKCFAVCICLGTSFAMSAVVAAEQRGVVVECRDGKFRLVRDGVPYFVRGGGGSTYLAELVAAGGNSIRTWDAENAGPILDEAQKNKLTVCVGFWLGHERHGFNYRDASAVLRQLDKCTEAVRKYKDHPAVLMWGVGNEMEGDGTNPAIWYAVDHIARECKRLDANHPTMTVISEPIDRKVRNIERFCPNIDIIGVNSYGGIETVARRYRAAGGAKPYILTEFGPHGPWEVGKTPWGSPIEPTSTAKAEAYAKSYQQAVASQPDLCVGSYAFLWGHKQETTATWFGMLLPDGHRLAPVDAMTEAWTGSPPKNRCPRIESLTAAKVSELKPGEKLHAKLVASDPEHDSIKIRWVLCRDSGVIGTGGDPQTEEISIADAVSGQGPEVDVTVPSNGGGYRLFAYVADNHGGAAVANLPLQVSAPIMAESAPKSGLPFVVYADDMKESPYIPSGFMGNTAAIQMTPDCTEQPHAGRTCLRVEYQAADQWGGVLWQSPANDWDGTKPGGLNLSGATQLEFWVRGSAGGEVVNFTFGVLDGNQPYRDTAHGELKEVTLTNQWQKLRIPLDGRDLSRIKTAFGWSLAGQGKPVKFYLDDIRYCGQ